jgi:hypothetical protein
MIAGEMGNQGKMQPVLLAKGAKEEARESRREQQPCFRRISTYSFIDASVSHPCSLARWQRS